MTQLILSQGKLAVVDDVDGEWANQWKWCAVKVRNRHQEYWYAIRNVLTGGKPRQRRIYLHREIAARMGFDTPMVDHKDGNGLDNRRNNLRPCDRQQNLANSRKTGRVSSSPYKGVTFIPQVGKWQAGIKVNQRSFHLGWHEAAEDAARAYDAAALKHFGEFAATNVALGLLKEIS